MHAVVVVRWGEIVLPSTGYSPYVGLLRKRKSMALDMWCFLSCCFLGAHESMFTRQGARRIVASAKLCEMVVGMINLAHFLSSCTII